MGKSGRGVSVGKNRGGHELRFAGGGRRIHAFAIHYSLFTLLLLFISLAACADQTPQFAADRAVAVTIIADGENRQITTDAGNVRDLLRQQNIILNDADEVLPPLFTPLEENQTITIVRVTESVEIIERSVPFERRIARSEALDPDEPPRVVQAGKSGLEELTVRIVYRDGIESERRITQITPIVDAQPEIMMIGIGAATGNLNFAGIIAMINGGAGVIYRGNTAFPEQLSLGGDLDGRVFVLSPTGSHLLYTAATTDTERFNSLFVISVEPDAEPRSLGVDNILWADWNPDAAVRQQIAYSSGIATGLPPGWEANNDLWVGELLRSEQAPFIPRQIVEAYPATYGWWGGNYAWSPNGRYMAFAHADEVGVLDLEADEDEVARYRLQKFTEYTTGGDWAWVPSLSWSADGQLLAFSAHAGNDPGADNFDAWVIDVANRVTAPFVQNAGMWSHPHWSPVPDETDSHFLASLRATVPLESERSSYALWLMDQDGSNARQIYPAAGENSAFPRDQQFMSWGPTGRDIAFIFSNALHIYNLDSGEAHRVNQDDALASHPSWAPYGSGIQGRLRPSELAPLATPTSVLSPGNVIEE